MTQKTYDRQSAKFIARVIENMPELWSNDMQFLIDNPKFLQLRLYQALVPEHRRPMFKKFIEIKLGNAFNSSVLIKRVEGKNGPNGTKCHILDRAMKMMNEVNTSGVGRSIELVAVKVKELGFEKATSLEDIFFQALKFKLVRCPAEVGPQLRIQYTHSWANPKYFIAMDPIDISPYGPSIFFISNGTKELNIIEINGSDGRPNAIYDLDSTFIFCVEK
jgi:hypothetical protein